MLTQALKAGEVSEARHYKLHGLGLTVSAPPDLLSAMDGRLQPFAAGPDQRKDLQFHFCSDASHPDWRPRPALRAVYEPERGEVLYDDANDRLHLAFDHMRAACDPVQGVPLVSVCGEDRADRWLLSHPVLTLPLLEMLKRRGLYSMHAAG